MRSAIAFLVTWPLAGVGLFVFFQNQVEIQPEQVLDYQVGSGALGLIAAVIVAVAVK